MPPVKIIKEIVGRLMAAFHECTPYDPNASILSTMMFYSSSSNQFGLDDSWRSAFKKLAAKCGAWLDQYPLQGFGKLLETVVADAREAAGTDAETNDFFRKTVEVFFKKLARSDEWEVIKAVFGIDVGQTPFSLGPCRFLIMDDAEMLRWEQRRACACHDPPAGTRPFFGDLGFGRNLLGNWVGCLRVRAIDGNHATAKATYRLEEVLNVLRHGFFSFGIPQQCVRAGLGHPAYWNHQSMCVRVYPPGGFQDSAGEGAKGLNLQTCTVFSGAWAPLQSLVTKEATARTGLEATVLTALEWVGNAAAASLASVRLVSLVTALEVLVIVASETMGKRRKLAKRVAQIVPTVQPNALRVEQTADRLYQVRSECLHEGATQVEDDDIKTAYGFVDAIITSFLTKDPFCKCENLNKVLNTLREPEEFAYAI
jgi:hypothetical protein